MSRQGQAWSMFLFCFGHVGDIYRIQVDENLWEPFSNEYSKYLDVLWDLVTFVTLNNVIGSTKVIPNKKQLIKSTWSLGGKYTITWY